MEEKESEYNSNDAVIKRFNFFLEECAFYSKEARINGPSIINLNAYKNTLLNVYTELSSKLTKNNKKKIVFLWKQLQQQNNLVIIKKRENEIIKRINIKTFNKRFNLQHRIELVLRRIGDQMGWLMKDKKYKKEEAIEW